MGNNVIRRIYAAEGLLLFKTCVEELRSIFAIPEIYSVMSTNIEDDEAPPDLVDVSEMPAGQPASVDEEATPRVPITLVTGKMRETWILILNWA